MTEPVALDTDVVIDFLRGQPDAVAFMQALRQPPMLSVVVVAELFSGVRDGKERQELDAFLAAVQILELDNRIAVQGGLIRRQYAPSHNVGLADAFIAATAMQHGAPLVTLNSKHFPMLPNVIVPYHRP